MKKIIPTLLLLICLQTITFAQKTRVFDGEGLNIKFEFDNETDKIYDLMFTGTDATGKTIWKKTELIDITKVKLENEPGFRYQVKDDKNTKYEVVFNKSFKYVNVHKLNAAGERTTLYRLYERNLNKPVTKVETKTASKDPNVLEMKYNSPISIKFLYNKKTEYISELQIYFAAPGKPGEYKTIGLTENEGGVPNEMYAEGEYNGKKYLLVYKPKNMNTVKFTVDAGSKSEQEHTLKLIK